LGSKNVGWQGKILAIAKDWMEDVKLCGVCPIFVNVDVKNEFLMEMTMQKE